MEHTEKCFSTRKALQQGDAEPLVRFLIKNVISSTGHLGQWFHQARLDFQILTDQWYRQGLPITELNTTASFPKVLNLCTWKRKRPTRKGLRMSLLVHTGNVLPARQWPSRARTPQEPKLRCGQSLHTQDNRLWTPVLSLAQRSWSVTTGKRASATFTDGPSYLQRYIPQSFKKAQ